MKWSVRFDALTSEWVLSCPKFPHTIRVPGMREQDAIHLAITLEQAKARIT